MDAWPGPLYGNTYKLYSQQRRRPDKIQDVETDVLLAFLNTNSMAVAVWLSGNAFVSTNVVALGRTRFVPDR